MANIPLDLDLDTASGVRLFVQAIDDPVLRAQIATTALPEGAKQLIEMLDDPIIVKRAYDLESKCFHINTMFHWAGLL